MSATERHPARRTRAAASAGPKKRESEILDAAAEIFHRKGYSETSVKDVADAVGILKGSLYYYIDAKEDLLFRMLLEVHEEAKAIVTETAKLGGSPLERLRSYISRHVEYNARNLAKIAVYYHDFGMLTPKRKQAIIEQRHYYEDFVRDLIVEARAAGEIAEGAEATLVANAIFGAVNWIYTWYDASGSVAPDELGRSYAELLIDGVVGGGLPRPAAA